MLTQKFFFYIGKLHFMFKILSDTAHFTIAIWTSINMVGRVDLSCPLLLQTFWL